MDGKLFLYCVMMISAVNLAYAWGTARVINIFDHQKEDDILELREGNGRMFNALYRTSHLKWPKSNDGKVYIPYAFDRNTGYSQEELQNVTSAMERIRSNTCVNFVPWKGEEDYIIIQNKQGEGCYTNVGRVHGPEVLQLESSPYGTCMPLNTVIHELMHITGLWHEHMRTDRDQYIKVHYENIEPGKHNQFKVVTALEATTYNVPYDYTSVMHYGKTAFSSNGGITMETRDPAFQDIIGTRADASPSDYRKICEIYECNECNGARGSNGFGNGNGITGIGNGNGMTGIGNGNDITGMGNGNGITGIDNGNGITGIDNGNHIVRPEPYTAMPRRVCRDRSVFVCKQLEGNNIIDCNWRDTDMCCATCELLKTRYRPGGGWFDNTHHSPWVFY